MRITTKLWIITSVLLMAGTAFAQAAEKESSNGFYHLDFVTKELDDNKVINSRTYSMIVSEKDKGTLRTGSKIAIPGRGDSFQYYDVGVNLDCNNLRELQGQLSMTIVANITVVSAETASPSGIPPVVRSYTWSSTAIVPLRKATQIFSSDDLGSKRKLQLEVIATPIK